MREIYSDIQSVVGSNDQTTGCVPGHIWLIGTLDLNSSTYSTLCASEHEPLVLP